MIDHRDRPLRRETQRRAETPVGVGATRRAVPCRAVRYWSRRAALSSSYVVPAFYRRL